MVSGRPAVSPNCEIAVLTSLIIIVVVSISLQVFFFCLTPAKDGCGGETPIVRNRQLMAQLDKEVLTKIGKNLMYTRYSPDRKVESTGYMTWQQILETDDRKVRMVFIATIKTKLFVVG